MSKVYRIISLAMLILIIFSNFTISSDTKSVSEFEAKTLTELQSILNSQLSQKSEKISIRYRGKTPSIEEVKNAINVGLDSNTYISSTVKNVNFGYSGVQNNVLIYYNVTYLTTKEEDLKVSQKIDEILGEIITDDMYTYEKVKAVNDYIVLNGQYDTELKNYSHYQLLFEGKSVCNGYALLTYEMLKKLHIPVLLVTGNAYNGSITASHIWNLVNIGGYWFNLDTTWNDPTPDMKNTVSYDYFLITDEVISKSHKADNNLSVPKTSISYEKYLSEFEKTKKNLINSPTVNGINIKIHDSYVDFKKYGTSTPFIENARTLVPLRGVFSELGYAEEWNNITKTAAITNGKSTLKIKPGELFATIDGKQKVLDVPAKLINGSIMVPVKFIGEAFDNIVLWDEKNKTVIIF